MALKFGKQLLLKFYFLFFTEFYTQENNYDWIFFINALIFLHGPSLTVTLTSVCKAFSESKTQQSIFYMLPGCVCPRSHSTVCYGVFTQFCMVIISISILLHDFVLAVA